MTATQAVSHRGVRVTSGPYLDAIGAHVTVIATRGDVLICRWFVRGEAVELELHEHEVEDAAGGWPRGQA